MSPANADIPYGTLDLMVLKTLDTMGPLNGYAVARRIEQIAEGSLALNQGTIYPALLRLEQKWLDQKRVGHERHQPPRGSTRSPKPERSSSPPKLRAGSGLSPS
jgi:DNA-binding PadR family transcriptional regulator